MTTNKPTDGPALFALYLEAEANYTIARVAADHALSVLNESRAAYDAALQERSRYLKELGLPATVLVEVAR